LKLAVFSPDTIYSSMQLSSVNHSGNKKFAVTVYNISVIST